MVRIRFIFVYNVVDRFENRLELGGRAKIVPKGSFVAILLY